MIYLTLFFVSLGAATLLPFGSEALFLYDISTYPQDIYILWFIATIGNTLGSVINYYIGAKGEKYLEKKGYLKHSSIQLYKNRFDRYGGVLLLLAWMPVIGDPITFIAGVLRYKFSYFIILVSISKGARYAILALSYQLTT